jgi:hypothetical protein
MKVTNSSSLKISSFSFHLELATLYKQCPGDREIEEYIKRIHALRQRMIEASIHVKIIEVVD